MTTSTNNMFIVHINGNVFRLANPEYTAKLAALARSAGCVIEASNDGIGSVLRIRKESKWPNYKLLRSADGSLIGLLKKRVINGGFTWSGETSVREFARTLNTVAESRINAAKNATPAGPAGAPAPASASAGQDTTGFNDDHPEPPPSADYEDDVPF